MRLSRLLFLVWLAPATALAYRPFDSTDADVAEYGTFELEFSPIGYLSTGGEQGIVIPNVTLNYGFYPGFEVVLEGIHDLILRPDASPMSRITDTGLYVKHVLRPGVLQDKTGISLATECGALLPEYHDEPRLFGAWAALIASYRWSNLALHLNGAIEWTNDGQPGTEDGLIIEGPDRWAVRPVAEGLVEWAANGEWLGSGLIGAIWTVSPSFSIDAAARVGDSSEGRVLEFRAGFTWSIQVVGAPQSDGH